MINGLEEHQIDSIHPAHVDHLEPIPLTEEWLKRFGFNSEESKYVWRNDNRHFKLWKRQNKLEGWYFHVTGNLADDGFIIVVKWVHQLQNLYFNLTGEELTVND